MEMKRINLKVVVGIALLALIIPFGLIQSRRGVSESRVDGQMDSDVQVDKAAAAARNRGRSGHGKTTQDVKGSALGQDVVGSAESSVLQLSSKVGPLNVKAAEGTKTTTTSPTPTTTSGADGDDDDDDEGWAAAFDWSNNKSASLGEVSKLAMTSKGSAEMGHDVVGSAESSALQLSSSKLGPLNLKAAGVTLPTSALAKQIIKAKADNNGSTTRPGEPTLQDEQHDTNAQQNSKLDVTGLAETAPTKPTSDIEVDSKVTKSATPTKPTSDIEVASKATPSVKSEMTKAQKNACCMDCTCCDQYCSECGADCDHADSPAKQVPSEPAAIGKAPKRRGNSSLAAIADLYDVSVSLNEFKNANETLGITFHRRPCGKWCAGKRVVMKNVTYGALKDKVAVGDTWLTFQYVPKGANKWTTKKGTDIKALFEKWEKEPEPNRLKDRADGSQGFKFQFGRQRRLQ